MLLKKIHLLLHHFPSYLFSSTPPPSSPPPPPSSTPPLPTFLSTPLTPLMDDYTLSPTIISFSHSGLDPSFKSSSPSTSLFSYRSSSGLVLNSSSSIQLSSNPLALQVLSEGSFQLEDPRIRLGTSKIMEGELINDFSLKSIDLGEVKILHQNAVALEDLDVYNIPEDKDVVLNPKKKKIILLGKKVSIEVGGDSGKESNYGKVGKRMFEEFSFEEMKEKHLFGVEALAVRFNYRELLRMMIKYMPIWLFAWYWFLTVLELRRAQQAVHLFEEQEMEAWEEVRKKEWRRILMDKKLFRELGRKEIY